MKIEIKSRYDGHIIIAGDYQSIRNCLEQNQCLLLRGTFFAGANLAGAFLAGANLAGANLEGAKGYVNSHDIFQEVVRRQRIRIFSEAEWAVIGQITVYHLCWDTIKHRFGDAIGHVFDILAEQGFDEWQKHWNEIKT